MYEQPTQPGLLKDHDTYTFRTSELHVTTALLYKHLKNDLSYLPKISQSAQFPY